jgi:hypothetical protein
MALVAPGIGCGWSGKGGFGNDSIDLAPVLSAVRDARTTPPRESSSAESSRAAPVFRGRPCALVCSLVL